MTGISENVAFNSPIRRSIGTLLVWAVNLPLVVALAVLLPVDYRREMEDAIAQKHRNLEEEAMTIHQGLLHLAQEHGPESVQRYIETVCAHRRESESLGHHIAVRFNGNFLQAQSYHRASPEILLAMQQAIESAGHRAAVGDQTVVVGAFAGNGMEVYVSEYTTNIRRSIQREIWLHLGWLAALAVAAAAIINLVLWRLVTRPVRRLSNAVSRIAVGDYAMKPNGFRSREMNELSGAIKKMSHALATNEREHQAQMDRARRIQEHLLPNGVLIPGLTVAHLFKPADDVAGDYYDLICLSDGTWLICMADVAGHGVAAAMGSAMLKALVLHAAERHGDPPKILQFVNERLPALLPDEYVTMFLARWDAEHQRLDYASAGHEPGILLSASGDVRKLLATGLPLGIDQTAGWETETITLAPDQRLLLTTDGVTEARSPSEELFGRQRLIDLAINCADILPAHAVTLIRDAVLTHQCGERASDDVTILLLQSTPPALDKNVTRLATAKI